MSTVAEFFVNALNLGATVATIIGGYVVVTALLRWHRRANLYVGLLPDKHEIATRGLELAKFGKEDPTYEFVFRSSSLALRTSHWHRSTKSRDDVRLRRVLPRTDGTIELFVVVANLGLSEAEGYGLVITFKDQQVSIVDVQTENLTVTGLYTGNPDGFKNKDLKSTVVSRDIERRYADFGLPGSYLDLTGSLPSKAFEAVYLVIMPPAGAKSLTMFARIEYSQDGRRVELFTQDVRLEAP